MDGAKTLRLALALASVALVAACAGTKNEQCSSDLSVDCASSSSTSSSSSSTSSTSSTSSGDADGGKSSSGGDGGTTSSSGSSGDGGASSSGDGGTSSSGGTGAFAGAPAYVQTNAQLNSNAGPHKNGAARGLICLDCHKQGGQAGNAIFLFAGTLYTDTAGTVPAGPGVEVRVLDGQGKAVSVYTDTYGNFAELNGAGAPAVPWKTGFTAHDALQWVSHHPHGVAFKSTGQGASLLVTEIDGITVNGVVVNPTPKPPVVDASSLKSPRPYPNPFCTCTVVSIS